MEVLLPASGVIGNSQDRKQEFPSEIVFRGEMHTSSRRREITPRGRKQLRLSKQSLGALLKNFSGER